METKDALVMINSELRIRQSERLEQIFETVKGPLLGALTAAPICYGVYYLNDTFGIIVSLIALAFVIFHTGRALDDLKSKELNEIIRDLKQIQYQLKMDVNIFEKVNPEDFKKHLTEIKKEKAKKKN